MSNVSTAYKSAYTGTQIDEGIDKANAAANGIAFHKSGLIGTNKYGVDLYYADGNVAGIGFGTSAPVAGFGFGGTLLSALQNIIVPYAAVSDKITLQTNFTSVASAAYKYGKLVAISIRIRASQALTAGNYYCIAELASSIVPSGTSLCEFCILDGVLDLYQSGRTGGYANKLYFKPNKSFPLSNGYTGYAYGYMLYMID